MVTAGHPDNAIAELITENTGFLSSQSVEDLAGKIRVALCRYPVMKTACIASAETYDWDHITDRVEIWYQLMIT